MLPLETTPATIIVGLLVIALIALAIRRVRKKGICDCGDCADQNGCSHCSVADKMVADIEKNAKKKI